jgi:hypothetical protein
MRLGGESMELLMTKKKRTGCMIITLLLCGAAPALAQTTPSTPQHEPLQKTIGQAKPEIVPSLIVMNARGASQHLSLLWGYLRLLSLSALLLRTAQN